MSSKFFSSTLHKLCNPTPIFGLKLWIVIAIGAALATALVIISVFACRRWKRRKNRKDPSNLAKSRNPFTNSSMDHRLLSRDGWDLEMGIGTQEKHVMYSEDWRTSSTNRRTSNAAAPVPAAATTIVADNNIESLIELNSGPVEKFTLREIDYATSGLANVNVIGSGNHGVVYRGFMSRNNKVAVKNLFSNRRGEMCFVKEAEALLMIRHKNLVKLLGYCIEGANRMLVYEYVGNGNLKQWLHNCPNNVSPLTWNIRMKIIIGIAKGLAYLHEDTEPSIIHRNLKSSNILLDQQWNPKISDFGITKLLGPEWDFVKATPAGMSGYISPEYASYKGLDEKSDVYSFGILIMEIISGRTPTHTNSSVSEIEECLVDWIKSMVAEEKTDLILDPNLPEFPPSSKELKRLLLIALRCVDFEVEKRPKMGAIIHMLEPRDLLLSDETVIKRQISRRNSSKEDQFIS